MDFRDAAWFSEAIFIAPPFTAFLDAYAVDPYAALMDVHGTIFTGATFRGLASFSTTNFRGSASFGATTFEGEANFLGAIFDGDAGFPKSRFGGEAVFSGATFACDLTFAGARFEQLRELHILCYRTVDCDQAVFAQQATLYISARRVSLHAAVLEVGGNLFVRWAELSLEGADFREPSLLARLVSAASQPEPALMEWETPEGVTPWVCRLGAPSEGVAPRVVSLRHAKVAQLTLAGVDLRACRFQGAYGLGSVRLERVLFASPPSRWRIRHGRWPTRWTRRQTLAEEHLWRHVRGHGTGWYDEEQFVRSPDWLAARSDLLEPEKIAGLYRALRKGREDNKDEPGAADFYYGEAEMRRQRPTAGYRAWLGTAYGTWAERVVLWLYWLVSGYGLRASRSLCALFVAILLVAIGLDLWGFEPDRSYTHTDERRCLLLKAASVCCGRQQPGSQPVVR